MRPAHTIRGIAQVRVALLALALSALALLAGCGGVSTNITPNSTVLLATAAQKLTSDTAFHFLLTETNSGNPTGSDFDVRSAEGDVVQPDKLHADPVSAVVGGLPVTTAVIVVGNQAWYKNPITGQYQDAGQMTGQFKDVATFLGPGLAAALASLQDVSAPSDSSANGVATWKINATISSDKLSALTNGEVPSGKQYPVQIFIGKDDGQLHQLVIPGKLTSFDTDQTSRSITLSKFNESVTITPPPGS